MLNVKNETINFSTNYHFEMLRVSYNQHVNYCYLVIDMETREAIVIDPAWEMQRLIKILSSYEARLTNILITHHHFDHIHLAEPLSDYYGADIIISKQEVDTYKIRFDRMKVFSTDGCIDAGSINVTSLLTPGHTKGSSCYVLNDGIFTGDTLFNEGCGMCLGNGASPYDMFNSLKKIKNTISNTTKVYPGHRYYSGLGQSFSMVLQQNLYLSFIDIEAFVKFRMRKNQTNLLSFS